MVCLNWCVPLSVIVPDRVSKLNSSPVRFTSFVSLVLHYVHVVRHCRVTVTSNSGGHIVEAETRSIYLVR